METAVRRRLFVFLSVLLLFPPLASAQDAEIFTLRSGECALTLEANERWHTLRLRVHPETVECFFDRPSVISVLGSAFSKTDPPRLEGPYSSLYIGRLVGYPWLSRHLADAAAADARWDGKRGKPVRMDINKFVATLLSAEEVTAPLNEAIAAGGYRVASVTVEKVLVDRARRVPYDAQVWFNLRKR